MFHDYAAPNSDVTSVQTARIASLICLWKAGNKANFTTQGHKGCQGLGDIIGYRSCTCTSMMVLKF